MGRQKTSFQKNNQLVELLNKYKVRQLYLWILDVCSILLAIVLAINLTGREDEIGGSTIILLLMIYIPLHTLSFILFKAYSSLWRYAGEEELFSVVIACIVYVLPAYFIHQSIERRYSLLLYILTTIFIIVFTGGIRLSYRAARRLKLKTGTNLKENTTKVLVVGGGSAGGLIINELKENPQLGKIPIGAVDDDISKVGRRIHNIKILGTCDEIPQIVKKHSVDEIILAMANIENNRKRKIMEICELTSCKLKTIPGIYEIIDGKVDIKTLRNVEIEDLLGRDTVKVNLKEISDYIQNKVVLVTGGGGSIGSELCRQIAKLKPKHLIILDNYENNAYSIQQELKIKYKDQLKLSTIIASVREETRMEEIFKEYLPEVIFHAAAHKHVPLMEASPSEAIKNNIFGTLNVARLADKYKSKRFVLISTDKAVNPTNIMGATKRAAEMIIQTINENSDTEFVAVRFGNVLGSNGSVIPLFKKQITAGGPVTITHPEIIRYFMTIPEAVQLVIQAGAMAKGGEIFILDMGDPVKIVDLANNLIRLSGLEPGVDIHIEFTGLRPGEKLYEELLMAEEGITNTEHNKIFIGKPIDIDKDRVNKHLEILRKIVAQEEVELIDNAMKAFVPTYIDAKEVNLKEVANV